jgi:hypothetical protein
VLIALLLPAVQAAREAARRTQCANNLKQLALGLQNYHGAYKKLPYGSAYRPSGTPRESGTWVAFVLPYVEQQALYDLMDFNIHLDAHPPAVLNAVISTLICPSDPQSQEPVMNGRCTCCSSGPFRSHVLWYPGSMGPISCAVCRYCPAGTSPSPTNYCCQGTNCGDNTGNGPGMFTRSKVSVLFSDVLDGLSNTIMLGETLPRHSIHNSAFANNYPLAAGNIPINTMRGAGWNGFALNVDSWTAGNNHSVSPTHEESQGFKSLHPTGAQFAMGDGSVRFLKQTISYIVYCALGTRKGSETYQLP